MSTILYHPFAQSLALPFLAVLLMAGLALRLGGQRWTNGIIAAVIGLGLLASYVSTFGLPPFPPRTSSQKFFSLVFVFMMAGTIMDLIPLKYAKPLFQIIGATGLFWLVEPNILRQPSTLIPTTFGIFLLWHITTSKMASLAQGRNIGLWYCVFIATTFSLLASANGSLSIAQKSLSIGSCAGGLLIYSALPGRIRFSWALLYVCFGPILLIASQILLYEGAWRFAVLPAFGILFADGIISKLLGNNYEKAIVYRITLLFICLGSLLICLLLSFLLHESQEPYY